MHKILTKKFQKPSAILPPNIHERQTQSVLGKRRRPLQPGELIRRYYPTVATSSISPAPSSNQNDPAIQPQSLHGRSEFRKPHNSNKLILQDVSTSSRRNERTYNPPHFGNKNVSFTDSSTFDLSYSGIPLPSRHSVSDQNMPSGIIENSHSNAQHEGAEFSCNLLDDANEVKTSLSEHHNVNRYHGGELTSNSFSPTRFYGEEGSGDENEEQCEGAFRIPHTQDQHPFARHGTESACTSQDPRTESYLNPRQDITSHGVSTLSTQQLLGLFAISSTSSSELVSRKKKIECADEFELPIADDSSDDED
jgi:hypothetical protein